MLGIIVLVDSSLWMADALSNAGVYEYLVKLYNIYDIIICINGIIG